MEKKNPPYRIVVHKLTNLYITKSMKEGFSQNIRQKNETQLMKT